MIYKSILLILGYLYGTMLTATFVVKHSTGNDVSKIGSGNPGMANVMEHIGKKEGVLVLAGDILKVIVAGILGHLLFPDETWHDIFLYTGFGAIFVTKLEKESGLKNILTVIKSLLDKEALFVKEELRRTYKPKTEARVRLVADASGEENLRRIFDELERAPKQLALLMKYVELSGVLGDGASKEVSDRKSVV